MTNYEVWLSDQYGNRLQPLIHTLKLQLTMVEGGIGVLSCDQPFIPNSSYQYMSPDMIISVFRGNPGRGLELLQSYFLRGWETKSSPFTHGDVVMRGAEPEHLLQRRVAWLEDDEEEVVYTEKVGISMHNLVKDNLLDSDNADRNLGTKTFGSFLSAGSIDAGPVTQGDISWKNVLKVLQDWHRVFKLY